MKRRYKPSVFRDVYHEQSYSDLGLTKLKLYKSSKNSLGMVQRLDLMKRLPVHNGCVNSISWNETGDYILSGSDDQHIVVSHGFSHKVLTDFKTSHRANIFSAKFLPGQGDRHIVSCSGDGIILFTDLNRPNCTSMNQFSCHSGTTYDVITVPSDPYSFLSCGEDGTVRWFDLRVKDKCRKSQCKEDILITCQRAVTSLSMNPTAPYQLAVGCSDSRVRLFDRRMLGTEASGYSEKSRAHQPLSTFTAPSLRERSCRITSLHYSPDGQEILVSFSSDLLYLFSMKDREGNGNSTADCDVEGPSTERSPAPVRRLRLRGDWSDTGPNARPERDGSARGPREFSQTRRTLHASLMQRMTDVLARMLNDPATRANLNSGRLESRPEDQPEGDPNAAALVPGDASQDLPVPPNALPTVPLVHIEAPPSPMFPFEHPLNESFAVNPFLPLNSVLSPDLSASTEDLSNPIRGNSSTSPDPLPFRVPGSIVLSSAMPSNPPIRLNIPEHLLNCAMSSNSIPMQNIQENALPDPPMSPIPNPAFEEMAHSPMSPDQLLVRNIRQSILHEIPMTQIVTSIYRSQVPDSATSSDPTFFSNIGTSVTPYFSDSLCPQQVADSIFINCSSNQTMPSVLPDLSSSRAASNVGNSSSDTSLLRCEEPHCPSCSNEFPDSNFSSNPPESSINSPYRSTRSDNTGVPDSTMPQELQCDGSSNRPPAISSFNQSSSLTELTVSSETSYLGPESLAATTIPQNPTTSSTLVIETKSVEPTPGSSSYGNEASGDVVMTGSSENIPGASTDQARFTIGDPESKMALVDPLLDKNFRRDSPLSPTPLTIESIAIQVAERNDVISEDELEDENMSNLGPQDMELVLESNSSDDDGGTQQFPRVMFPRPRQVMIPPADETQLRSNEDLIDTLHSMRDRHPTEPAVLLSVSEVTDAGAAFAVRVATDNNRGPPHIPYLMENQRNRMMQRPAGPPPISDENEASYSNEEMEDDTPNVRLIHPIEREMDSAIAEARSLGVLSEDGSTFQPSVKQVFSGHRNARTMIKEACFWGTDYVMSGSDCGHVFVWERCSGQLVQLFEGDEHVVNCLQPHPTLPVLATSGIDYDVKLWAPLAVESTFDSALADMLKKRNEIMLEETKDTITVPATFMIRMLACLNQIRRGGRRTRLTDDQDDELDD